jgi:hypothetical protein
MGKPSRTLSLPSATYELLVGRRILDADIDLSQHDYL